ncbi:MULTISPECIES: DnaD domain-containing protein [unclassified Bacillus (in: firmicutes)]|uniref:DnaD domain-containing protein n=1 Tax=unclassified Bacillus (in: firmicutes) TaxID=185979 RepID=UPI00111FF3AB|nr:MULTISPECIES: DnaD domain-containing protein [unclassified Bacillus (in: firmicutes)]
MTIKNLSNWIKQANVVIPSYLLSSYKEMGLNEQEMMLLLHVENFSMNGNSFPTPAEISSVMNLTEMDCTNLLRKLVQHGFLDITEDEKPGYESYSIKPLFEKLAYHYLKEAKQTDFEEKVIKSESLYTVFEKEFGRPLSPFEGETLTMWLDEDKHSPDLVKAALKEAVISGKLSFRYIDRILFDWKKHSIKTLEQAKAYSERFRSYTKKSPAKTVPVAKELPLYNWLE